MTKKVASQKKYCGPEIHCKYESIKLVRDLIPHPKNPNRHGSRQIELLSHNIKNMGWRHPIVVSSRSGLIVAGHARLEAAKALKLESVPVDTQTFQSESEETAYLVADNKIAELAEMDTEALSDILSDLNESGFDVSLSGYTEDEFDRLITQGEDEQRYTKKIIAPTYEPKGKKPPISKLMNLQKTNELINEIENANIPDDVAIFLKVAATRHTVFSFRDIAEFYCHSDATVQDLMEKSGLVIIDFDKAIENGFVHITKKLGELVDAEGAINA